MLRPDSGPQLGAWNRIPARSWSENGSPCASCGPSTTAGAFRTWSNSTQAEVSAAASTPRRGCCWRNSGGESPAGSEPRCWVRERRARAFRAGGWRVERGGVDIQGRAIEATRRNAAVNGFERRVEATQAPLGEIESVRRRRGQHRKGGDRRVGGRPPRAPFAEWMARVSGISPGESADVAALFSPLRCSSAGRGDERSAVVLARRWPGV